jgi:hypothetical protein
MGTGIVAGRTVWPACSARASARRRRARRGAARIRTGRSRRTGDDRRHAHRQEGLSIGWIAINLGVPEYRLRQLVN